MEKKKKTESKIQKKKEVKIVGTLNGKIGTRGKIFEGKVIKKFPKRLLREMLLLVKRLV